MSRFNKWLPFFEESSEQRDVASWDKVLRETLPEQGIKVIGVVSDRAKPLVKASAKQSISQLGLDARLGVVHAAAGEYQVTLGIGNAVQSKSLIIRNDPILND